LRSIEKTIGILTSPQGGAEDPDIDATLTRPAISPELPEPEPELALPEAALPGLPEAE